MDLPQGRNRTKKEENSRLSACCQLMFIDFFAFIRCWVYTLYAKYWNDVDQKKKYILSSIKCAEVLVPNSIPYEYVESAIVFDEEVKNKLSEKEFDKEIFVNADLFFGG